MHPDATAKGQSANAQVRDPLSATKPSAPSPAAGQPFDRELTLRTAADLATTHGLTRLTPALLAEHLNLPQSEISAHFSSNDDLQMAAIETAVAMFKQDILRPATRAQPGLKRLFALCDAFLDHVRKPTFRGGCFFASAAAELDTCPGRARERVLATHRGWMSYLELCLREARKRGEIDASADVTQLSFEIDAMLALGNIGSVLYANDAWIDRAAVGVRRIIDGVRTLAK